MSEDKSNVIEMTAEIVSSYAANNNIAANDLPGLIRAVHDALAGVGVNGAIEAEKPKPAPAVPLKKAVQPDFVVDLFTGKKFKSLKRHLRTVHNMTPEEYRAYWGLPKDSSMVAPNYAAARSALAKSMGLGQGGRKAAKAPPKRAPRKAAKAARA
jgi:predicted transcriptional regulator